MSNGSLEVGYVIDTREQHIEDIEVQSGYSHHRGGNYTKISSCLHHGWKPV